MTVQPKPKISANDFLIARPFGVDGEELFDQWFDAVRSFIAIGTERLTRPSELEEVNSKFTSLTRHFSRSDKHLFRGKKPLYESARKLNGLNPSHTRATRLLEFQLQFGIHNSMFGRSEQHAVLPSPLWFLRQILTSDEFLASEAYAHCIVRAEIFAAALRSFPPRNKENIYNYIKSAINYAAIADSISTLESYYNKRDTGYIRNITDFIVYNYFASLGLLRFSLARNHISEAPARRTEYKRMSVEQFLDQRSTDISREYGYEVLLAVSPASLPAIPQILNELEGIPIPIPGAKTLFSGGVRTTESGGVVVRISGTSGSGKTSLALAACTALAPLGIKTFYLSCEEEPDDLRDRIPSVTPSFILETRNYQTPTADLDADSWFFPDHLSHLEANMNFEETKEIVSQIMAALADEGVPDGGIRTKPLGLVPFVIVLDGVHELIDRSDSEGNSFSRLNELIDHFRKLNIMIFLLSSADKSGALSSLDYLVDVVIELDGRKHSDISHRPLHMANLTKTRRQFSNTGQHHYHISKRSGVRFYPNLEASLEPFKARKWKKPNDNYCIELGHSGRDLFGPGRAMPILWRSHTLVTGKGSSGKAGFALKLLTSPVRKIENRSGAYELFLSVPNIRRCLIISFLYPDDYYDELIGRLDLNSGAHDDRFCKFDSFEYSVLTLYPGHLAPEVLMTKIVERIQASELQGIPFDSVLIDGLHNVFLQFPELEANSLFWPMLSELFRRIGLNVVTTHAHFDVVGMDEPSHLAHDIGAIVNRSTPLVQALVNSADYYFDVSPEKDVDSELMRYKVRVATAYGHAVPRSSNLFWNREKLRLELED